ncbi:MAG TPA: alpha/beta family hydrolase [Terriglobales bacterium]
MRSFLHIPAEESGDGLVLTHGAGADCRSRLLTAVAGAFAEAGFLVLRCDLPFRQRRPHGPPSPATSALDREGLRRAVGLLQKETHGRIFLGGHSYGGRQSTILATEDKSLAAGLLLLSYPLHPPRRPLHLRTAHFTELATPALFVHGSRDPFGTLKEMTEALQLIAASTRLLEIDGGGHDLLPRNSAAEVPARIVSAFQEFFR